MSSAPAQVSLSSIDEERFGVRTARASVTSLDDLASVMDFCRKNDVVLLVARCPVTELKTVQSMEKAGFILTDTLVFSARDLIKAPIPSDAGEILVRSLRDGEENDVKNLAAVCYHGYIGHYHSDEKLDDGKCDEAYASWAYRSCVSREVADEVLVADANGSVVGFFTLRLNSPEEGEAVLSGVDPSFRGRGLYRSFMIRSMEWFFSQGAARMVVSTQITNVAVQKVWARLGFEHTHALYTFHKWFDYA